VEKKAVGGLYRGEHRVMSGSDKGLAFLIGAMSILLWAM
jgi:hypothetical protein